MVDYLCKRNLDAALATAAAGLHVFPARVGKNAQSGKWDKVPIIKGWQQGSTDEEQIRAWWDQFPKAVPGIALGRADLLAIDPDRHGGPDGVAAWADLVASHGRLPAHPITITPSGGEHHLLRQSPELHIGNREGQLPSGINVRGRGGFILAQGAVRSDGKAWVPAPGALTLIEAFQNDTIPVIPEWLLEIVRGHRARAAAAPSSPRIVSIGRPPTDRETSYGARVASAEIRKLAAARDNRNIALNNTAFRLGQLAARGWIDPMMAITRLRHACRENGLLKEEPHKVEKTLESGWQAGVASPQPDLVDRPYQRSRGCHA
jgi:hypothetical protein